MTNPALAKFGVDASQVPAQVPDHAYPKEVAGRVAHIDADFTAYMVSYEYEDELNGTKPRRTLEDMYHNALVAVDHIRRMAGAERGVLHVTHKGTKGGRDDQAVIKPYQANRKDKEKPEHLDAVRLYLGGGLSENDTLFTGTINTDQEADDAIATAVWADQANAVCCSEDKDLRMVPGWKLSGGVLWNTGTAFGSIELDSTKSAKKVVGGGTKFFWAQLLMGDQADNISGVPMVPGRIWQQVTGTKAYQDLHRQWIAAKDAKAADKIAARMTKLEVPKKCGPVLTYELLKDCRTDKDCWEVVRNSYYELESTHGYEFRHWRTGELVGARKALFGEMQLLWMRRSKDPMDVAKWLKGVLK